VTGTNGKSTISYLLEDMLRTAGRTPGVIGTVNYRWPGVRAQAPNTTPEGPLLYRVLAAMAKAGCDTAVMEISSHALSLGRVRDLRVAAALMTNLTRDHLDHHGSMEAYYQAKRRLFFENLAGRAAVGLGDPYLARLAEELGPRALTYGLGPAADVRGEGVAVDRRGVSMTVETPSGAYRVDSRLLGSFNVLNLLGAAALGEILGLDHQAASAALSGSAGAPGRLQRVGGRYMALVDYAHTPSALAAALRSCRALGPARLFAVFGCGGDRDRGKRPLMGREAGRLADLVILTSDNPRTEDPLGIIDEAAAGLRELGLKQLEAGLLAGRSLEGVAATLTGTFVVEPDRRAAIRLAMGLMEPEDLVLVAGKGHEDYQIIGLEKTRLDDVEEVERALAEHGRDRGR
jgi:UDP-N-acetylmuramoyl-L-alanyl-D-glutamate--2,6-diaminopimelate ligase